MKLVEQKIFIDANVLIDILNQRNNYNEVAMLLFNFLIKKKYIIYCSPTSFAITYYFLSKSIKNKKVLNKVSKDFFSIFTFTREDKIVMKKVLSSNFADLEDGLQYYSALDAKVDIIITKNYFDFSFSSIPVYHPLHYVTEFVL